MPVMLGCVKPGEGCLCIVTVSWKRLPACEMILIHLTDNTLVNRRSQKEIQKTRTRSSEVRLNEMKENVRKAEVG